MPSYEDFKKSRKRLTADTSSYEFMGQVHIKLISESERDLYDDLVRLEVKEAA